MFCLMMGMALAPIPAGEAADIPDRYEPTWESLEKHPVPSWFKDAKFGIFIHWGVYSVPGWAPKGKYAEWYPRNMYREGSPTNKYHKEHYGDPAEFTYNDFIPMFKAEKWDPHDWADLFVRAGAAKDRRDAIEKINQTRISKKIDQTKTGDPAVSDRNKLLQQEKEKQEQLRKEREKILKELGKKKK